MYTNSLADYSAYSNGYLKFWYKSAGYTWIKIQSMTDGITNTARGVTYGPTTNESGVVVGQQKIVPASSFTNIDFSHIRSPFMVTDPKVDRTYSVDYVCWEATL